MHITYSTKLANVMCNLSCRGYVECLYGRQHLRLLDLFSMHAIINKQALFIFFLLPYTTELVPDDIRLYSVCTLLPKCLLA